MHRRHYYPEFEDINAYENTDNRLNKYGDEELNRAHIENMVQRYRRLMVGSLAPDNIAKYQERLNEWEKRLNGFENNKVNAKNEQISVEKPENSGIIAEESSQKKTKESSFAVDWSVVDTEEYDEAFDKLSSNPKVSKAIKTRAKWALSNRDLSQTEEIYAISLNSGEEIGRITTQHNISAVKRTKRFTDSLNLTDKKG